LLILFGFMTAPLIVKPFLQDRLASGADSSFSTVEYQNHTSSVPAAYDLKDEHPAVKLTFISRRTNDSDNPFGSGEYSRSPATACYAFIIVAVYSLFVAFLMLSLSIVDFIHKRRKHATENVTEKQSNENATLSHSTDSETNADVSQDPKKLEEAETDADEQTSVALFRTKTSLLFFVFNFFYGGIEVGYAGLVMTYAVTNLGWTKDNGSNLEN